MGRYQKHVEAELKDRGSFYISMRPDSPRFYKNDPNWHEGDTAPKLSVKESDKGILIDAGVYYTDKHKNSDRYYKNNPDWHEGDEVPTPLGRDAEGEIIKKAGGWFVSEDRHSPRYKGKAPRWESDEQKEADAEAKKWLKNRRPHKGVDLREKPRYVCDFETRCSQNEYENEETSVWLWCNANIETGMRERHGTSIEDFIEWAGSLQHGAVIYFHNLKFDGAFIMDYFKRNPWHYKQKLPDSYDRPADLTNGVYFTPLISDMGAWYKIEVTVIWNGKLKKKLEIYDSLKVIPHAVAKIAKDFAVGTVKGDCDYQKDRPMDYVPTEEEIDYCATDCEIVARALNVLFKEGLTKMTTASCAITGMKECIPDFDRRFPKLDKDVDDYVRLAYTGGYTAVNDLYFGERVENGCVLDVNSMYPYVMHDKMMPYGYPLQFEDDYHKLPEKLREEYPLFIQHLIADIRHKDGTPRIIQSPQVARGFMGNALYINNHKRVPLTLTNIDLEFLFKYYDVYNIEWKWGLAFHGEVGMFSDYIDKWMEVKRREKGAKRAIAKLMLNSCYGKFGTNPTRANKIPMYDIFEEKVYYEVSDKKFDQKAMVYTPGA